MFSKLRARYKEWVAYKKALKEKSKVKYYLVDGVETIIVALALALLIRKFIIQTSLVPTGSMIPTLDVGDRLFVSKFNYYVSPPSRGDIVVFKSPYGDGKDYVKRCVGLPGETIEIKQGTVYINEKQLILRGVDVQYDRHTQKPTLIPEDSFYVLGDNRANSADSRYWGFVPQDDLLGKALFTFWPVNHIRYLR